MNEERKRILEMLAAGKITADEAEKLLDALGTSNASAGDTKTGPNKTPRFMHVKVDSANEDKVDVKVPLGLIRAGMRLTSLIPPHAIDHINDSMGKHGMSFDLNNLKKGDIDELVENLTEMQVNVNAKNGDIVRVYCE